MRTSVIASRDVILGAVPREWWIALRNFDEETAAGSLIAISTILAGVNVVFSNTVITIHTGSAILE